MNEEEVEESGKVMRRHTSPVNICRVPEFSYAWTSGLVLQFRLGTFGIFSLVNAVEHAEYNLYTTWVL